MNGCQVPVSQDVVGEDLLWTGGEEGDEVRQGQGDQVAVGGRVQRLGVPSVQQTIWQKLGPNSGCRRSSH